MASEQASVWKKLQKGVVGGLFSGGQDCLLCLAPGARHLLCASCEQALPVVEAPCRQCGVATATGGRCGTCIAQPPAFDDVHCAFAYGFPVDRLVQRFKFSGDLALGAWLGDALADRVRDQARPQLLVPAPLSEARLRSRGFNQALVLARRISRRLGIPVAAGAIVKRRDTPSQAGLTRAARRGNLRDAFECRHRVEGLHVALVDDVMTTGATADALAAVLERSGATRVSAWVVARTPEPHPH